MLSQAATQQAPAQTACAQARQEQSRPTAEVRRLSRALRFGSTPKGPRTQIIGFLGPKYYNINSIWALKPYYLGPWTLRGRALRALDGGLQFLGRGLLTSGSWPGFCTLGL